MSFPFQSEFHPSSFNRLVDVFRSTVERFPDERMGDNVVYSMADAAMGAFSVFFTQSPSFLDFQRSLAASGAVTLIQRFGFAANLNKHA